MFLADCIPSAHFLDKKEKRGVSWDTIREIVENPQVVEFSGRGRRRLARGDLAIVATTNEPMVLITILLRQQGMWTDDDVRQSQEKK